MMESWPALPALVLRLIVRENPKYEARNTKQYQITKIRNSKQIHSCVV